MSLEYPIQNTSDKDIDETGAWLSIGDLMSGLLMIFALLLVVTLLQLTEQLEKTEKSRVVVIHSLKKALDAKGINAEVNDKTGDISILDSVLFDTNSSELKPEGKHFLDEFLPLYAKVLLDDNGIADQITFLIIEGHTSSSGSWGHNMNLSMARAGAVYDVVDHMNFPRKKEMLNKLMVAGRGKASANQRQEDSKDRKVVFRIQFRGDEFSEWFLDKRPGAN
tara:strand:- start:23909 stop:24574 length:666 start_codon:yes stop_codon:yes gene_type:complete